MKYVYIALIVALLAGGYYVVSSTLKEKQAAEAVPEGYHRMSDGTLMRNSVMGTEGMGALAEMQNAETMESSVEASESFEVSIDTSAKVFDVTGVNHAFDTEEIRVKKGDTVTINFESTDGYHDWVLDEFGAATEKVQPGVPTSVTFVADEVGTFEYYCSVGSHRVQGMVGTFIVEE